MSWALCNLYSVLGVCEEASGDEIKTAYRRAALQHHPDKGGSVETFKLVAHAFETLFCPNSRERYDRRRTAVTPKTAAGGANAQAQEAKAKPSKAAAAPATDPAAKRGKKAGTVGSARRKGKSQGRFIRILRRLFALLAAVPKEDRRGALESMSVKLRAKLQVFAEERQRRERACQPSAHGSPPHGPSAEAPVNWPHAPRPALALRDVEEELSDEDSSTFLALENVTVLSGADVTEGSTGLTAAKEIPHEGVSAAAPSHPVQGGAPKVGLDPEVGHDAHSAHPRKNVRFPGIYMRQGWKSNFYVAAAGLENFTIFSRNVRSLEEAVNYHIALLQVKRLFEANSQDQGEGAPRPFRERLKAALREAPSLEGLGPSFYTVLTCARSFGAKKIRSPATVHLQEALDHHQHLTEARAQGHQALRAAWAAVLQVERVKKAGARGNAIKRPRTSEEAEEVVAGAERAAANLRALRTAKVAALKQERARATTILGRSRAFKCQDGRAARRLARLRKVTTQAEFLLGLEGKRESKALEKQRAAARRLAVQERQRARQARLLVAKRLREEERQRKRRWRERAAWLRKRGRTFAEEQQGPPPSGAASRPRPRPL